MLCIVIWIYIYIYIYHVPSSSYIFLLKILKMASTWMMVSNGFNMFQHFAIKTGVANSRSMADRIVVLWGASWHDGCGLWLPSWCLVAVGGCGPLGLQKFTVLRQIIPVESHKRWVESSNSLWGFPLLHTNAYKCHILTSGVPWHIFPHELHTILTCSIKVGQDRAWHVPSPAFPGTRRWEDHWGLPALHFHGRPASAWANPGDSFAFQGWFIVVCSTIPRV